MNVKNEIEKAFREVCENRNIVIQDEISLETVLLESGLDSLGFAILVTDLEMKWGYDPFTLMDEPFYPRTFGELVGIYEQFQDRAF